ncbi:MAG TPA: alpha-L-fucosidase [Candidatus Enterenecus faecium]|uniref:alpha-L-fucosidase n=3 Tax=Eubacteriales TaxID=186802 RepID=A0A9D0YQ66_9FIRM|nr:alpha-L-fucosidase [Candidatus Enterenecus faecium]
MYMKGKRPAKRGLALALAGTMLASTVVGTSFPTAWAAEPTYIGDASLTDNATPAPTPDTVLPNANQYWYQKAELSAFCHFGPNTFNEIEWGEHYGDKTPDEIFKLETDFDADTMVKTLKDAGFQMLIVTAKHHDGFCIWNSAYTEYDVANTSYKNGQGDILAELSEACTKYDMNMGLYLSPWDIHDDSYGYYDANGNPTSKENDVLDYNEYYNNQLQEILGNDKYGNDGHFVEVWMDGAKGSGANAQEYDFQKWFDTIQSNEGKKAGYEADCMLFGAEAYTTVRWIGNENGYAADDTWSKSMVNYENNTINSGSQGGYTVGLENGNQWTVPECDARITSGWFWGTTKNTPKTIAALGEMYFRSVGHNGTFLLNVPPNNQGTVDQAILDRVTEFGQNVQETFKKNLATSVQATNVRGNDVAYKPGNTIDGNDATYWTTEDGTNEGTLLIDLGGVKSFDVVSVEEAIQNGQRINSYKVEYRDASGEWHEMQSGQTIGAKRLVRTGAVRGDQVRITVSTPDGKVPMISEVGVYKASEGFELSGAAPDGMDVIDIKNGAFQFSNGWTDETGSQFIGGTNKWANAGATFTVNFTGSKIYLLGTKDPNHGKADIYIDGEKVSTIDTNASARALGQYIFVSEDLADGEHTLELRVTSKAIGIEAAYTINNGGKGMIGIEESRYTMNEDQRMDVKLVRVGGTSDEPVTVRLSPNPGSAIQDDFNTELNTEVTFQPGQTEATAPVETRRNTNITGDREFTIELSSDDKDVILGFNPIATVTIKDMDSASREQLEALVNEAEGTLGEWYSSGWDAYAQAVAQGKELLASTDADQEAMAQAVAAIQAAKGALVEREQYSADDPVPFPWQPNSTYTVEAEFAILKNTGENEAWPLQIAKADWASHGKFVNCLNQNDTISFPYVADRTGTYTVTATYRSGDTNNSLAWSEVDGKITSGTVSAGAGDSATATHTVTFDIEVTEAGAGTLVFTGPAKKSPQLDKLVITPKNIDYQTCNVTVTANEGGTVSPAGTTAVTEGESFTLTITPDAYYHVESVVVNGETVTVTDNTYTLDSVTSETTIEVTFAPDVTRDDLQALVDAADGKVGEWYTSGWDAYAKAIADATELLKEENPSVSALGEAKTAIETALAALVEREQYTTEDPFYFPNEKGVSVTLEAEFAQLHNVELASDGQWALCVAEADWASHGEFINCLNQQDTISFPYEAKTAGTYTVTATYRSGDTNNSLAWSEPDGKIASGTVSAGAGDSATQTHTVTFEIEITEAGAGTLVFTGPDKKSPQLDKLVIELKEAAEPQPVEYTVTVNTQGEGTATAEPTTATAGTTVTLTQQAAEGWHFVEWQSDDVTVTDNTFVMPEGNVTVTAVFEKDETPEPGDVNKTLLEKTVAYAETLSTNGVTDTAKKAFEDALANAKTVLADADATQDEVNAAWNQLLEGIWGLGLVQGDKDELNRLIAKAEDMMANADKYMEENWQQLVDALAAAQDVAADGDAMDEDIKPVAQALLDAILAQRFKANKDILEDLIGKAEGIDLTGYTAESVATFRTALQNAQAVMADETLTEDDQATVNAAVAALSDAMNGLTAGGAPETTDKPEVTDKPESTDQPQATEKPAEKPAQTGDSAQLMLYVAALAAAVMALGAVTVVRKRRSN